MLPASSKASLPVILLLGSVLVAGCGGKFSEPKPDWLSGYRWEYDVRSVAESDVEGQAPPDLQAEADREGGGRYDNSTVRMEIFNTTGPSVDGFLVYVGAEWTQGVPDEGQPGEELHRADSSLVERAPGSWSIRVFNPATLNPVDPVRTKWSKGEVQLSTDDAAGKPRIANERRLFEFPLTSGKTWTQSATLDELNDEDGTFEAKVYKQERRKEPAGTFDTIRLRATTTPRSTSNVESQLRSQLQSQGYEVKTLAISYLESSLYWFAPQVRAIVEQHDQTSIRLSSSGTDPSGAAFDFAYSVRASTDRRLIKYELTPQPERPLLFARDVLNGAYVFRPISPTADFAVEALADRPGLNALENKEIHLEVRVYNSTAGEHRFRNASQDSPAAGTPGRAYDHELLAVNWTVEAEAPGGWSLVQRSTADALRFKPADLGGVGLKRVTLELRDRASGEKVSDDQVFLDVYWESRQQVTATADNVTDQGPQVFLPVAFGARFVNGTVFWTDATPHAGGDLRVYDAQDARVDDEDSSRASFATNQPRGYAPGTWRAQFRETFPPSLVGAAYTFDLSVHYRSP